MAKLTKGQKFKLGRPLAIYGTGLLAPAGAPVEFSHEEPREAEGPPPIAAAVHNVYTIVGGPVPGGELRLIPGSSAEQSLIPTEM